MHSEWVAKVARQQAAPSGFLHTVTAAQLSFNLAGQPEVV